MVITPLAIEIMIECYRCSEPGSNIPANRWNSPAARDTRDGLVRLGLIEAGNFKATMRGEAYIGALMTTPVPEPECGF
jgi:hypothetical protein